MPSVAQITRSDRPFSFGSPWLPLLLSLLIFPLILGFAQQAHAEPSEPIAGESTTMLGRAFDRASVATALASASIEQVLDGALDYLGIRYRRGGSNPESGFDCSGFVRHIFRESIGLSLPRSARDMSRVGQTIEQQELKPGDLVFFNTMRRAFSHVGIYLGDHLFIHSPRVGGAVRIEDMRDRYWIRRFDGARRIVNR